VGAVMQVLRVPATRKRARAKRKSDELFDQQHGVETATSVLMHKLDTKSPNREHAIRYEPSDATDFRRLMNKLRVDHADFAFVDYGSGKGRVLILAAEYPFKRIVGVEFAASLDRVARANVAAAGADPRIELVFADAVEFDPPSEPLVLYFYNPFRAPVLEQVLARVRQSLERTPRQAYVVIMGSHQLARTLEGSGFEPVDVDRLGGMTRGVFAAR
jgi:hypothetical protein